VIALSFVLAAALQQQTPAQDTINARIVVRPVNAEIPVGDSVRLSAEVRDLAGSLVPNARVVFSSRRWGVIYKNGLSYINDNHNGLWIVRIEPKGEPVP
jgi:hypothetical protein